MPCDIDLTADVTLELDRRRCLLLDDAMHQALLACAPRSATVSYWLDTAQVVRPDRWDGLNWYDALRSLVRLALDGRAVRASGPKAFYAAAAR